jgi:hypothetical protein
MAERAELLFGKVTHGAWRFIVVRVLDDHDDDVRGLGSCDEAAKQREGEKDVFHEA